MSICLVVFMVPDYFNICRTHARSLLMILDLAAALSGRAAAGPPDHSHTGLVRLWVVRLDDCSFVFADVLILDFKRSD